MTISSRSGRFVGTEQHAKRWSASSNSLIARNSPRELLRKKRNQAIYDVAGLITEKEARSILKNAVKFVDTVKERIDQ